MENKVKVILSVAVIAIIILIIIGSSILLGPTVEVVNVTLGPHTSGGSAYIDIDIKNMGNKGQINIAVKYQVVREIWKFSKEQGQYRDIELLSKTASQSVSVDANEIKLVRLTLIRSDGNYNNLVNEISLEAGLTKKIYHLPFPSV